MRTKTVKVDNFEVEIGALTLDQVEEYLAPIVADNDDSNVYKLRTYDLLSTALNNAGKEKWDRKRITAELDLVILDRLQDEILAFSGLRKVLLGEAQAAAEK